MLKEALAKSGLKAEQVIIIAFSAKVIAEAKKQMPDIKAFWLTAYKKQPTTNEWKPSQAEILRTLKESHADGFDSDAHERVDTELADALRAAKLSLHVWTVDKPEVAARFWKLGVESITTNRPEKLRREVEQLLAAEQTTTTK